MGNEEFQQFWTLMRELFPAAARKKSENAKRVWEEALIPYALRDAVNAAMAWARKSNFFPDVANITAGLQPVEAPPVKKDFISGQAPDPDTLEAFQKHRENVMGLREWYPERGLLTPIEAKRKGMSYVEWAVMLEKGDVDRAKAAIS